MPKTVLLAALLGGLALTAGGPAALADPSGGHGHAHAQPEFSAGAPGDSGRPARRIPIVMTEADGKMLFAPERLEVRRGDQVRFVLQNDGELEHEFVLATAAENVAHAKAMEHDPGMAHEEPNARRLDPKKKAELLWRFTRRGEFEFACNIPGHREAGMVGKVRVR